MKKEKHLGYWQDVWERFWQQKNAKVGSFIFLIYVFLALYAPFFASSKPLFVVFDGSWYFPLFRYLLSSAFFSKKIDLFFNLLALFAPFLLIIPFCKKKYRRLFFITCSGFFGTLFITFAFFITLNPAKNALHENANEGATKTAFDFTQESASYTPYAKLNLLVDALLAKQHHEKLLQEGIKEPYSLFALKKQQKEELQKRLLLSTQAVAKKQLAYMQEKEAWIECESKKITKLVMPPLSNFHWQDDVGGDQATNRQSSFWTLVRLNRKDVISALLFGARISLFVGITTALITLAIGIPLGLFSGYFGAKCDLVLSRFVEVWESLPTFFMLLLIVTMLETKSIFFVISIIALFSWTSIFRFVRAETLKQREMLYVDACKTAGFGNLYILFYHLLPNCLIAVLALLPFDMMSAITREAGLAFLGLGEEDSPSWGQLMDEGRQAFPAESMLLWPPAIALTILLISIACIGEAAHGACNPKTGKS